MGKKRKRFASYYNTYFEKIYRYIFFRTGRDRELAEDLTSEVMLKAYEAFEDFDEKRNFGVWIYRIARNHLIDHYKKAKKEIVSLEDAAPELKIEARIVEQVDEVIEMEQVETALEHLPEEHKEIVVMKYYNGLSHKEIAKIMNKSEANIRVLAHRAVGGLKKRLSFLTS